MPVTLVNPNTSARTTTEMVRIARAACPALQVSGLTAPFGADLITNAAQLDEAARAVAALLPALRDSDAVIVAAFGDPGCAALRARLACPVIGLAEAAMAEAAAGGRRFAVVTTTPDLVGPIAGRAAAYGHAGFAGTWITPGDPVGIMADEGALIAALDAECRRAIADGGAEAIVIGGGPLARAAEALAGSVGVPLIAPVPAAMRRARQLLMEAQP